MTAPEFSRPYRCDAIGAAPLAFEIAASPAECAALASRFGLVTLRALTARGTLVLRDKAPIAEGYLHAEARQACVVTGEPVPVTLDEPFALRFVSDTPDTDTDEIELTIDAYDDMPLEGDLFDLGEAVAQSLALALPRFPRGPNAARVLREAGVVPEGEETRGAFAALKDLLK